MHLFGPGAACLMGCLWAVNRGWSVVAWILGIAGFMLYAIGLGFMQGESDPDDRGW